MKKILALAGMLAVIGSASADAASLNIGIGVPIYPQPIYAAPAPYYAAPVVAEPVYPAYVGGYYGVRPHGYYPRHREYDWREHGYRR